jgi:hypothetical protein
VTEPPLGASSPETRVNVVDFPQPVGPTIAQNCPGSTTRLTSWIAVKGAPSGARKRFVTPQSSIRASIPGVAVVSNGSVNVVAVTVIGHVAADRTRRPDCRR